MGGFKEELEDGAANSGIASSYIEVEASTERKEQLIASPEPADDSTLSGKVKKLLWHGGSTYDAWFSSASNQVAQVLLTLPTSFAQLGLVSGVVAQLLYALMGCWAAYLMNTLYLEYRSRKEKENANFKNHVIQWFEVLDGLLGPYWKAVSLFFNVTFLLFGSVIQLIACASNIYLINDSLEKRTWTYIFGGICGLSVFIPTFHNYRVWSFLGIVMTSYTAWYITIGSLVKGQVQNATHVGAHDKELYFTGATNVLYTFGGHAATVEIMHAMWKPSRFKLVYVYATLYVLTLTLPSAVSGYWAFGDNLLKQNNVLYLLPRNGWRDTAVIFMLLHQFITFGFAITPVYFIWEKLLGIHTTGGLLLKAIARIPVVLPVWFFAIIFPFFGPINSAVGALLVTFTVYIIPCAAHMMVYRSEFARRKAVSKPPFFFPSWTILYLINASIILWILVIGVGWGGWASVKHFVDLVSTFGVFDSCFQCPPRKKAT